MPSFKESKNSNPAKKHSIATRAQGTTFSTILSTIYYYTLGALFSNISNSVYSLVGSLGMARWARDIVRIIPSNPGVVKLRSSLGSGGAKGGKGNKNLTEWINASVPSLTERFTPAAWLPNGHLQTLFTAAGDFTKVDKVHYIRTYLRLPDGGTLGIDATPENHHGLPADAPTVVVCHGLTGGSHESYVRNILAWVTKPKEDGGLGGRGVVVNFRGCAGVPVTSCQLYSAGTTMDLALALHFIRNRHPSSPLIGIGFSLGASVISRYLGEYGSSSILSAGVVLGCPWDLTAMSHKLEDDWFTARVYSSTLGRNVLRLFFKAYDQNPAVFEVLDSPIREYIEELKVERKNQGARSRLRRIDDLLVSKIGGPRGIGAWPFPSAKEYYDWASPTHVLRGVRVPLFAINAFDDPVVDGGALPLDEFVASSHIYTAVTGGGGHLGWFDGPFFDKTKSKQRWVLKPVSEFISACTRDLSPPDEDPESGVDVVAGSRIGPKGADTKQRAEANGSADIRPNIDANVEANADCGWEWVVSPKYKIPGLEKVGWKVLREGEVVEGESDEGEGGLVQGL
ncbi:anon-23da protein [Cryptococcus neoformans]|nr:anon-23da protein [Cryptococcus neoformans var. grubii Th84]OXH14335.1 anon-23da protein [Cryptococcus neoformans var. grubii]OXH34938.1 anon-23da protein [Cryptococcus neoformans var. grubii]OXH55299.1 anon-23da protein [Cryptococcus neoformans var. grubii]OXH55459.1 anon-23da protein [Cryptococcus neoformans var. grubii]